MYVAYTAPHWPVHARDEDVAAYDGACADGWDALREQRLERLHASGLVQPGTRLSERDPSQPAWSDVEDPRGSSVGWQVVRRPGRGDGPRHRPRSSATWSAASSLDDTIVVFLPTTARAPRSCRWRPEVFGGRVDVRRRPATATRCCSATAPTWCLARGRRTPLRAGLGQPVRHAVPARKRRVHEGRIATPFAVRCRSGLADGEIVHTPFQLIHVLPTLLEAAPRRHPAQSRRGGAARPARSVRRSGTLCWEHLRNCSPPTCVPRGSCATTSTTTRSPTWSGR